MPFVTITCPHCNAQHMTFDVVSRRWFKPNVYKLFCQCRNCSDVVVITAWTTSGRSISQDWTGNICDNGYTIKSIFPPPSKPVVPFGTPDDVGRHFTEGLNVLSVKAYPSAANCFRRTLEKATDHLLDELNYDAEKRKNMSLKCRIKALRKHELINPLLYDWAHIIRDVGNQGTHGDTDFSENDAVDLRKFTEIFLIHVFTMPANIREMRDSSSTKKTKSV